MESDGQYLTALSFTSDQALENQTNEDLEVFQKTRKWLDAYFSHHIETEYPPLKQEHATAFQKEVYEILKSIPYGKTVTYKDIAKKIASQRGQAVGQAVGSNRIAIIIGCHRVIGTNGKLTGYRGGLKNKKALLNHEKS